TLERCYSVALERGVTCGDISEIDHVFMHHLGDDMVRAPIYREQAEGRKIAGVWRHDASLRRQQIHYRRRLCRPGATERQQREDARVDATLDCHLPDRVCLI